MSRVLIYGLIDPRTNQFRYIGRTVNVRSRYNLHMKKCKYETTHKSNWLRQLSSLGLEPTCVVLDEVSEEDWALAENAWISYGLEQDWPLTNSTLGGDGSVGMTEEVKEKLRRHRIGRSLSEDTKRKIGAAGRGRTHTNETKRKISESNKGKKRSPETCKRNGDSHRGRIVSEEQRRKISEGNKGKILSEETRRKIGDANRGKEKKRGHKQSLEHILKHSGESNGRSKHTVEQVLRMRKLYEGGTSIREIATVFRSNWCTVRDIVTRRSWKYLP